MKDNKTKMIAVLAIIAIIAVGYIVVDKYTTAKQEKQNTIFQQGAQFGYQQAVVEMMQSAVTCQPVPLFVGNATLNMIAVECLQG